MASDTGRYCCLCRGARLSNTERNDGAVRIDLDGERCRGSAGDVGVRSALL